MRDRNVSQGSQRGKLNVHLGRGILSLSSILDSFTTSGEFEIFSKAGSAMRRISVSLRSLFMDEDVEDQILPLTLTGF